MFSIKANLEMKKHQFIFELISIVKWKPIPVNDPSSFFFATLVYGVIGYKFCWLLPSEDHNQGTPAGHESNGTIVKDHWEDMNQLRHQLGMNHYLLQAFGRWFKGRIF